MQNSVKKLNQCGLNPEVVNLNDTILSSKDQNFTNKSQASKKSLRIVLQVIFNCKGGESGESSGFIHGSASNPEFLSHSPGNLFLAN